MLQWNPKQSWVLHLDKKTSPIYVLNIRVRKIKCLVFQWFVLAKFRYAQNNSRWVESLARILMSPPQWKPLCFFGEMRRQLWESWPSSPHILHCVVTPHCLISDLYQIYRFGLGMASELCIMLYLRAVFSLLLEYISIAHLDALQVFGTQTCDRGCRFLTPLP